MAEVGDVPTALSPRPTSPKNVATASPRVLDLSSSGSDDRAQLQRQSSKWWKNRSTTLKIGKQKITVDVPVPAECDRRGVLQLETGFLKLWKKHLYLVKGTTVWIMSDLTGANISSLVGMMELEGAVMERSKNFLSVIDGLAAIEEAKQGKLDDDEYPYELTIKERIGVDHTIRLRTQAEVSQWLAGSSAPVQDSISSGENSSATSPAHTSSLGSSSLGSSMSPHHVPHSPGSSSFSFAHHAGSSSLSRPTSPRSQSPSTPQTPTTKSRPASTGGAGRSTPDHLASSSLSPHPVNHMLANAISAVNIRSGMSTTDMEQRILQIRAEQQQPKTQT